MITNRTRWLLLLMCNISLFLYGEKLSPPAVSPVSVFDNYANILHQQFEKLKNILSDLAIMVNNNQITTVKSKNNTTLALQQSIDFIKHIEFEKVIHDTNPVKKLHGIAVLSDLCREVALHINKAIDQNLSNFKAFELNPKRSSNLKLDDLVKNPTIIDKKIKNNQLLLKKLSKKIDTTGLQWYNHAYRKINRWVIQPSIKYSIPIRLAEGVAVSACATYFGWHFFGEEIFPDFIRNGTFEWHGQQYPYLGPSPSTQSGVPSRFIPGGGELKLGFLGGLEIKCSELFTNGRLFLGGLLMALSYQSFKNEWDVVWPDLYKRILIWHNRLMGGAYNKRADKMDDNKFDEVYFNDLVGLDHVKERFKLFVDYLENPEAFDRTGLTPQKGCLLIGETRTGKTYSVKALFCEIKRMLKKLNRDDTYTFFDIGAIEINMMGIQNIMNTVKKKAPCIVFIDEIDLLNLQRTGKNDTLSQFLTGMSGVLDDKDPKNQVLIIAATNRPENLDEALRQPGRFGIELRYEYPSYAERLEFMTKKLSKFGLNTKDYDLEKLARETNYKSYESLGMLIQHAILKARVRCELLQQKHLEDVLDEDLRSILKTDNKVVPDAQTHVLATHFAGHALALKLLNMTHMQLAEVTIHRVKTSIKEEMAGSHLFMPDQEANSNKKRYEYGEVFTHSSGDTINVYTHEEKLNMIRYQLAGIASEELLFDSPSYSCHTNDKQKALTIAQSIIFEGLDMNKLPSKIQVDYYEKALALVETCKNEVKQLLDQNKTKLTTIIELLQDNKTLVAYDVDLICESVDDEQREQQTATA